VSYSSRRRFLQIALAGTGVSILAACSGSSSPTSPAAPAAQAPAPTTAPAAQTSGSSSGTLKIGVLSTNSGPFSAIGQDIQRATELYLAQNSNVLSGLQTTIIAEDEGATTQDALSKGRKLIEQDKVDVLMGLVLSNNALAMRDIIDGAKVPTIITNAGAVDLTGSKKSDYIFRVSFSNWQSGACVGKYAFQNTGKKAIAMAPDYAAGQECAQGFIDTFTQAGGTVVDKVFPPLGNSDYAPYLGNVKPANPDVVWAFFSTGDAIKYLQQWSQFIGSDIPLIGFGLNTPDVTSALGKTSLLAKYTGSNYDPSLDNPVNKAFIAAFKQKFNRDPQLAQYQYDGMLLLGKALEKTKGDKSPAALSAALSGLDFDGVRGTVKIDPETHGLVLPYYRIDTVQDGDNVTTKVGAKLGDFSPTAQLD
jgi:branched-chain amino acid transport system substrate-binding protein